jgi:hypothetical protein
VPIYGWKDRLIENNSMTSSGLEPTTFQFEDESIIFRLTLELRTELPKAGVEWRPFVNRCSKSAEGRITD